MSAPVRSDVHLVYEVRGVGHGIEVQGGAVCIDRGDGRGDMCCRDGRNIAVRTAAEVAELIGGVRDHDGVRLCRSPQADALSRVRAYECAHAGCSGGLTPEAVAQAGLVAEDGRGIGRVGCERVYVENWMS